MKALRLPSVALGAWLAVACLERRPRDQTPASNPCTACHGSAARSATSPLAQAAPPVALDGSTDPASRGVGAHSAHLTVSATHAAVPCDECHLVPTAVGAPGHADTALPAELRFGALARQDGRAPRYEAGSTATSTPPSCVDTYCHGDGQPVWTQPRDSAAACGSCHGLPPAPPHVADAACERCHGEVIGPGRVFKAPERHVDGRVDVTALGCGQCHGNAASPAPPPDLLGNVDVGAPGVGAHAVHLGGTSASSPVACDACHVVPATWQAAGHLDATPAAEVRFSGVATTGARSPTWQRASLTCAALWCHGPDAGSAAVSPPWTQAGGLGCDGCHGLPPAPPHAQSTRCGVCHAEVVASDDRTITAPARHVDGVVDHAEPAACDGCHGGSASSAPPRDTSGNVESSFRGVGAHQTHLTGGQWSRPVPCEECHQVPASVDAPGHVDTARPAELRFTGAAVAAGGQPAFDGKVCSQTWCHGDAWGPYRTSGAGNSQPEWTRVDGSQAPCGGCHGLPPPAPHPQGSWDCPVCHSGVMGPNLTLLDPSRHVDGVIDF